MTATISAIISRKDGIGSYLSKEFNSLKGGLSIVETSKRMEPIFEN
jgi:hypothetical protein